MKTPVVIGMMSEICMKAKMLRNKLKDDPDSVREVHFALDRLEEDMVECLAEFESSMTR